MRTPRVIAHPVMGWFVIILLATIVAVPVVYVLVSRSAAEWVAIGGQVIAINWGVANVAADLRRRSRRSI